MSQSNPTLHRIWWFGLIMMPTLVRVSVAAQEAPGLVVEEILVDSGAARAGVKVGDRVLSHDGRPLPSPVALQAAEENTFSIKQVTLRVRRGEETLTLMAPLGKLGIQVRPELPPVALTLYAEGKAQKAQTAGVIAQWTAAAKAAREAGDAAAAAWLYGRAAEVHEGRREWKEASGAHAAAWELLKQGSDDAARSRTLVALGRCSQNLNDFSAARQWYEQARHVDEASGNEFWLARDLSNLGNVAWSRGELPAAQDYFIRSLHIRERLAPDSLDMSASLHGLGLVAYRRGDLAAAQDHHRRALVLRERLAPNSLDVAGSLTNLGNVAWSHGDLAAAQDYHSRAFSIHQRLVPGSLLVAASLNNLGLVAWSRGDLVAAQDHYNRALTIYERVAPNSLSVANSLNNLGNVAHDRGDLQAAQDHQSRALEIRQRLAPNSLDVAMSLNNLGNAAYELGALQTAQDYHSRALAIRERLAPNSLDVAFSLSTLGDISRDRSDLQTAQSFYSRAFAIRERLAPSSLAVAASLNNLGNVAGDRGDLAAAQDYHSRALTLRERLAPDSLAVAASLNRLGGVALKQRSFFDALPLFTRAVGIVEAQRWQIRSTEARALLLAKHTEPYTGLLLAHMALNDLPAAFATAERARARSLLESLAEARAEIRQGVDPTLLERERELQQQLNAKANRQTQVLSGQHTELQAAATKKELDALLVQYQEVQAQIRARSPRYAGLTQPQPLGLQEIQQQVLDNDSLLLEYVLGEEGSYLFAVTPASIRSFELPRRAEIEQAARRVYELLLARQPVPGETVSQRQARIDKADAGYPAAAAGLSQMVLGPVAGQLSGQRLLVVADGALQYVPFGALPVPGVSGQGSGIRENGPPLIVKHEIISLPSASVVAVLRRELQGRKPAEKLVAVLADPVFDPEDPRLKLARQTQSPPQVAPSLPVELDRAIRSVGLFNDRGSLSRLPFTREESEAILAVAPAGQGTKAVDFKASRATATSVELGHYRIVHLATHGLLNTERPELSGIVLSLVDEQGKPQDGFLRLHEVYNLNLPAELVVLSACQTGLGKEIKGEGLVGLIRGFMYAGAKSVLASLWNVNDSVTAQLMKQFYQGMFVKGLPPAAALRAAQVEMWKRRPSRPPYYWAAFVLQGEWK
jgi:CHAT domain-containing protein/Tfp pilus assembly protein PilF